MTATQRTLGRARRRLVGQVTLRSLGWSLLIGAAVAAAAVVTLHAFGIVAHWWIYAALAGVALLVSLLIGIVRRPSDKTVAVMVDDRLKLKDSLGTSLYAATLNDNELTRRVIGDAEAAAATARVGDAFPVRPTRVWGWTLASFAVVALLTLDPFGLQDAALQRAQAKQAEAEQAQEIEELLAQAKKDAEELAEDPEARSDDAAAEDEMDPADLDEKLEAMLTQRDLSNPEDQREVAAEVSDLQEKFEEQIAQKQAAVEAMQNTLSQLDAGERGPVDDFADALRRGDFSSAQEELAKLADEMESGDMSESQKQRMAEQMESLGDQLAELAEQQQELSEQAEQSAQQAMKDAGLSQQQMDQLAEQGFDPKAVQEALKQLEGMSDEQKQQVADAMQQAMQQSKNSGDAGDAAQQLSQQMQQMAQAMQEQTQENQQMSEAMQQMQQQLAECADPSKELGDMKSASQKMQEAMQKLAGNGQQPGGQGQMPGSGGQSAGVGPGEGDGSGGNPIGDERAALNTAKHASRDTQEGQGGRVIASWSRDGQMSKGESTLTFNQAVTDAKADAERAVTEDRTPRRYHRAIKDYFGNLPDAPEAE